MKASFKSVLISALLVLGAVSQTSEGQQSSPKEVVEHLWAMATAGDLLAPEGWSSASRLFANPAPTPLPKVIKVVSNYYGVDRPSVDGNTARLVVWYQDVGRIDSTLRFVPAPSPTSAKTPYPYSLVLAPTHSTMFAADGKTVLKEITGPTLEWRINGPQQTPWTTVNTAIRYVLDERGKTTDSVIRKNADATITALLHYR